MTDETSGYFDSEWQKDGAKEGFSQLCDLPSRGYCRIVKAQRDGQWWVLKGLKDEYRGQGIYRELLRKEYEIASKINHEGIVSVAGMEDVPGMGLCIVMEWVDGETLREWLAGRPSARERRRVLGELLDAVEYMHRQQTTHRDIKPSNILVTRGGHHAKLIDFSLSDSGSYAIFKQSAGTHGYAAPEQESGSGDQRSDIYSIGCVMDDMRLGWRLRHVVRRCKRPVGRRYDSIDSLRRAVDTAFDMPRYAAGLLLAAALVAVLFLARTGRMDGDDAGSDTVEIDCVRYCVLHEGLRKAKVCGGTIVGDGHLDIRPQVTIRGREYTVEVIGDYALWWSRLKSVSLPPTLKYIGVGAFYGCILREVTVPDSVEFIAQAALAHCYYLTTVRFGSELQLMDMHGVADNPSLRDIYVTAATPPVCDMTDPDTTIFARVMLHVPAGSREAYANADFWREFRHVCVIDAAR